ncbi:hypothetical protein IV59_GL001034 [Paucilactobacillus hokkaidonensis]|nr:hypothetical protein IV59_GL001034 [Paucilactobacillus hokkaidonensis]
MQVETKSSRFDISEIIIVSTDKLILTANSNLPILTLDQFRARCRQVNPHSSLFYQTTTKPLFGYQLKDQYILLG